MDLTELQKSAILSTTKERDYCIRANYRTMKSLVNKGLAVYTSGFGYQFGGIVELTDKGKDCKSALETVL